MIRIIIDSVGNIRELILVFMCVLMIYIYIVLLLYHDRKTVATRLLKIMHHLNE